MSNWYLAACRTGQEERAEENLGRQLFEVYNPKTLVEKLVGGNRVENIESLFPNYIFVNFDPLVRSASLINNSRGVLKLLTFGDVMPRVDNSVLNLLKYEYGGVDHVITSELPKLGDVVEINTGPFSGIKAIYSEPDGNKRSNLLIEILGNSHQITVENRSFS